MPESEENRHWRTVKGRALDHLALKALKACARSQGEETAAETIQAVHWALEPKGHCCDPPTGAWRAETPPLTSRWAARRPPHQGDCGRHQLPRRRGSVPASYWKPDNLPKGTRVRRQRVQVPRSIRGKLLPHFFRGAGLLLLFSLVYKKKQNPQCC